MKRMYIFRGFFGWIWIIPAITRGEMEKLSPIFCWENQIKIFFASLLDPMIFFLTTDKFINSLGIFMCFLNQQLKMKY